MKTILIVGAFWLVKMLHYVYENFYICYQVFYSQISDKTWDQKNVEWFSMLWFYIFSETPKGEESLKLRQLYLE